MRDDVANLKSGETEWTYIHILDPLFYSLTGHISSSPNSVQVENLNPLLDWLMHAQLLITIKIIK